MGLSIWTFAGDGTGTEETTEHEAGTGCYKAYNSGAGAKSNTLTKNDFTCTDIEIILWRKFYVKAASGGVYNASMVVRHPSYGDLTITDYTGGYVNTTLDWARYRVWFWYDSVSNTKFGQIEKWVTDAWVQQGSDTNFGTGAPAAASIVLKNIYNGAGVSSYNDAYFDEIEAYNVVVE